MKIFIIDDDQLSSFLTENILLLEDSSLDITCFSSSMEALTALQSDGVAPDILFLDLNMPLMDGWEFLNLLPPLEPKLNNRCSVYILTSSVDTSDTIKMQKYPIVAGLLHKPLESDQIVNILCHHNTKWQNHTS